MMKKQIFNKYPKLAQRNPDGSYLSEDQMVVDLLQYDYPDYIEEVLIAKFTDDTLVGQAMGPYLRQFTKNSIALFYGLYEHDNPHVCFTNEEHPLRPDHVSARVLERFLEAFHHHRANGKRSFIIAA